MRAAECWDYIQVCVTCRCVRLCVSMQTLRPRADLAASDVRLDGEGIMPVRITDSLSVVALHFFNSF